MPGALLRTGELQEFKALGVDGQPVYSAALQLREAIRLKIGREAANCLAIPQPNESGERIDWYAAEEGDVVPWSAATEEERRQAYTQLESLHERLHATGASMRSDGQNREKQIFARLLDKTVHFPDSGHVYLVEGKPVVTFWGFTDQAGSYDHDPLLCLRPAPSLVPPATPLVPAAVVPEAVRRPWWRWLWLLLPLLLLLLLLLFLLRACAPDVKLPLGLDRIELPGLPEAHLPRVELPVAGGVVGLGAGDGVEGDAALAGEAPGAAGEGGAEEAGAAPAEPPAAEEEPGAGEQPESGAPDEAGAEPPEDAAEPREQPAGKDVPQELSIPPQALESGNTDFLNGRWKAGAGIQDAQTGKPMRLDYDFKDGQGQVRVRRGDGVECSGPVSAALQGGQLAINSRGQATCNDGSSYKLPEVLCAPGAQSAADCSGSYDNQKFPMSMRQDVQ